MLIAPKEMIKETSEKYRAATKVLTHETDIIIVLDWLLVGHINSETRPDKVFVICIHQHYFTAASQDLIDNLIDCPQNLALMTNCRRNKSDLNNSD